MKLTGIQQNALSKMNKFGTCSFYDLAEVGANGRTIAALVLKGLAEEVGTLSLREWRLTDLGHSVARELHV